MPVGRRAPVGQHGHAVADAADLVEAVGDVDDAHALGGEAADDAEERLDLLPVEDRRRLVHDQQADLAGEGAGDRDDLLGRRPQGLDLRPRRDPGVAEALEQGERVLVHLLEVEQPGGAGLVAEEDALGDRQVVDQVELLVDRPHAARQRAGRVALRERLAGEADLARGRLDHAGHALDEGRLAGAVGPEQAVDLARQDVEVHARERRDAGVLLDEPADLEDGGHGGHHRPQVGARHHAAPARPVSGVPPQTGSSCSTERAPSKPPSWSTSTTRRKSTSPRPGMR